MGDVFLEGDHYEPLLARFERRIYNLAAHREHLEVPFRYSPASRQGDYGDSIGLADLPPGEGREDIGYYFGTRRSDPTALALLSQKLNVQASAQTSQRLTLPTNQPAYARWKNRYRQDLHNRPRGFLISN